MGFPCGSAGKESACNMGDMGSIPGLGRSPGEGKGYPLLYSGLENSTDCIVHGVAKNRTRLSDFHTSLSVSCRFPRWLSGKEFTCNAGDVGSIPGSRKALGEGNGNPLQFSCLGNPMDRGAWWATVHGVKRESDTTEQLNDVFVMGVVVPHKLSVQSVQSLSRV